ncbi:MAG: hypothetical protein IH600_06490 [Bacteroidetes bacterium]|nr:hypothetical protein [Bacteroidota bacterium]
MRTIRHDHKATFIRGAGQWIIVLAAFLFIAAPRLQAQTEPEAPREPVKLFNGYQFAVFGGGSLTYLNGDYYGLCPCEFLGDETSGNLFYGASLNIPVFSDASIYLRVSRNQSSTSWTTARADSLRSVQALGFVSSELKFDYDILSFDVLLRLFGHIDGERVYIGPSFGFVRNKHIRVTDTELSTQKVWLIEDDQLDVEHSLRMSFVIGAEYAFVPFPNIYVIPAIEIDYSFSKIVNERVERPTFSLKPTFYRMYVTFAYQMF